MKELSELKPFSSELELIRLPACRIIGRQVQNGGPLGNTASALWDAVCASRDRAELEALPRLFPSLFGWTCEYAHETDTFVYLVCALTPADTPVPEGFSFRDVSKTLCAVGLYGESVYKTLQRAEALGYASNWSTLGCAWNAELYFGEEEQSPPKSSRSPWHWLVPIRLKER